MLRLDNSSGTSPLVGISFQQVRRRAGLLSMCSIPIVIYPISSENKVAKPTSSDSRTSVVVLSWVR